MANFFGLLISGILLGGMYAGMALGIVLLTKSTKIFNFSHGEMAVVGAYSIWTFGVQYHLPIYWVAFITMALIVMLAIGVERVILRPLIGQPLLSVILVTLGLGQILSGLVTLIWPGCGRVYPEIIPSASINLLDVNIPIHRSLCFLISLGVFVAFMAFFHFTRTGLAMRAISEDPQLSQSRGIRVTEMFRKAWFISIFTAVIIGMLLASFFGVERSAIEDFTIKAFVVVILGGLESIGGALIAGFILGVVEIMISGYLDPFVGGGLSELVPFLVMLLVLILKPYGLFGYVRIERI